MGHGSGNRAKPENKTKRIIILKYLVIAGFFFPVAMIIAFRFAAPPFTAFMAADFIGKVFTLDKSPWIHYQWKNWEDVAPEMGLAVIAAEDQKFPYHHGFDLESIQDALETSKRGGRLRGASTISQQVAKNLFLWNGRSFVRKGLEAYFALLIESLWPKKRILEVYINIAEFGDGVYGVGAASRIYFKRDPAKLTRSKAALLAAVLPNPKRYKVNRPSGYVYHRQRWILRQMNQLGGKDYLDEL